MKQSKRHSLMESVVNQIIGFAIGMISNSVFLPLVLGIKVPLVRNIYLTACFSVISIIRGYCVRRWFTNLRQGRVRE